MGEYATRLNSLFRDEPKAEVFAPDANGDSFIRNILGDRHFIVGSPWEKGMFGVPRSKLRPPQFQHAVQWLDEPQVPRATTDAVVEQAMQPAPLGRSKMFERLGDPDGSNGPRFNTMAAPPPLEDELAAWDAADVARRQRDSGHVPGRLFPRGGEPATPAPDLATKWGVGQATPLPPGGALEKYASSWRERAGGGTPEAETPAAPPEEYGAYPRAAIGRMIGGLAPADEAPPMRSGPISRADDARRAALPGLREAAGLPRNMTPLQRAAAHAAEGSLNNALNLPDVNAGGFAAKLAGLPERAAAAKERMLERNPMLAMRGDSVAGSSDPTPPAVLAKRKQLFDAAVNNREQVQAQRLQNVRNNKQARNQAQAMAMQAAAQQQMMMRNPALAATMMQQQGQGQRAMMESILGHNQLAAGMQQANAKNATDLKIAGLRNTERPGKLDEMEALIMGSDGTLPEKMQQLQQYRSQKGGTAPGGINPLPKVEDPAKTIEQVFNEIEALPGSADTQAVLARFASQGITPPMLAQWHANNADRPWTVGRAPGDELWAPGWTRQTKTRDKRRELIKSLGIL